MTLNISPSNIALRISLLRRADKTCSKDLNPGHFDECYERDLSLNQDGVAIHYSTYFAYDPIINLLNRVVLDSTSSVIVGNMEHGVPESLVIRYCLNEKEIAEDPGLERKFIFVRADVDGNKPKEIKYLKRKENNVHEWTLLTKEEFEDGFDGSISYFQDLFWLYIKTIRELSTATCRDIENASYLETTDD